MKTVDLFCGCGGMSLGFQNAGYEILAGFDNWEPAINVYRKNFTHPIYAKDLSDKVAQREIMALNPEIIIGGPPCQDFSSAGHRDVALGRAKLTLSYCDIITIAMPEYFVMENVPTITKTQILVDVKERFKKVGYGLSEMVIDASYCGVPQSRKRFVLVGHIGSDDGFLNEYLASGLSDKPLTMREYFGDSLNTDYYFRVPRTYSRRGVFSIDEPCQTIRGVDRPIPSGYKKHPSDPVDIGPEVRALTVLERSYVQTFPQSFIFEGSKTDLNQMIGNAVPVKLAEHIARAIASYDQSQRRKKHEGS